MFFRVIRFDGFGRAIALGSKTFRGNPYFLYLCTRVQESPEPGGNVRVCNKLMKRKEEQFISEPLKTIAFTYQKHIFYHAKDMFFLICRKEEAIVASI